MQASVPATPFIAVSVSRNCKAAFTLRQCTARNDRQRPLSAVNGGRLRSNVWEHGGPSQNSNTARYIHTYIHMGLLWSWQNATNYM